MEGETYQYQNPPVILFHDRSLGCFERERERIFSSWSVIRVRPSTVRGCSETFHSFLHKLVNEAASIPHPAPLCYSSTLMPGHTTHSPQWSSSLLHYSHPLLWLLSYPYRTSLQLSLLFLHHLNLSSFIPFFVFPALPLLVHVPGCCSDTEADCVFKMAENKNSLSYRRSVIITPKTTTQFNQFLPTQDKPSGYVPAPLRKKRAESRNEDNRRSWASPVFTQDDGTFTRYRHSIHTCACIALFLDMMSLIWADSWRAVMLHVFQIPGLYLKCLILTL